MRTVDTRERGNLADENAELREMLDLMYGTKREAERRAFEAEIENMRLLGIVRTLAYCANDRADCDACTMNGASVGAVKQSFCDGMASMLREIGIEVKDGGER